MSKAPFIVTHDGQSVLFFLHLSRHLDVRLIEMGEPRGDHNDALLGRMRERSELLNDLLHSGVPFDALATCRHSPGINGAILDPAAAALEALRTSAAGEGARA